MQKHKLIFFLLALFLFPPDQIRSQNPSVRYDFTVISVKWKSRSVSSFSSRQATASGNLNFSWEMNTNMISLSAGSLELTWELKSNMRGTAYGNTLLNRATDRNLASVMVREIKSSGSGAVLTKITVNRVRRFGNRLVATVPLSTLTGRGDGLNFFFSVIYPTKGQPIRSYQDGMWQQIKLIKKPVSVVIGKVSPIVGGATLTWTSAINPTNFPDLANTSITSGAQKQRIENHTIQDIVSSRVLARDDGLKCSRCHYSGANVSQYYRPPLGQDSVELITPNQSYYAGANNQTRTWSGTNGFADHFIQRHAGGQFPNPAIGRKPGFLRKLFEKWKNDGYR